jgi:hypothetical protein
MPAYTAIAEPPPDDRENALDSILRDLDDERRSLDDTLCDLEALTARMERWPRCVPSRGDIE